ncbi:hypothetical protein AK812_SmicGene21170 [Symbiodinium microadriaticum]|uniref:Uncharacterized protein n=1 Tax=Symbiodinium microadriaticum TaxID=2951 RepID=A0A1Q9DN11_SYMMI|nr:hypothetical protein AK812_SmicGene21170 [Symbiodinium microadriaticum]
MAPSSRARGVLMSSASSRKRKAPEEEEDTSAMESRLEWEAIDREAKQLVRSRLKADAGREVSGYDDVAGEGNADVPEPDEPKQEEGGTEEDWGAEAPGEGGAGEGKGRIDANRIVFYYDFDARGNPRRPVDPDAEEDAEPPPEPSHGDFRSALRSDLWDDSEEDEE